MAISAMGPSVAHGELVTREIAMGELVGRYVGAPKDSDFRTTLVSYDPPLELQSVELRLVGTAIPGALDCSGSPGLTGVSFYGLIEDPISGDSYWAFYIGLWTEEEFDIQGKYIWPPLPVEIRELVLSGSFVFRLVGMGSPTVGICAYLYPWAEATIAEAMLLVEGEFLVTEEQFSWGTIKALFR